MQIDVSYLNNVIANADRDAALHLANHHRMVAVSNFAKGLIGELQKATVTVKEGVAADQPAKRGRKPKAASPQNGNSWSLATTTHTSVVPSKAELTERERQAERRAELTAETRPEV